MSHVGFVMFYGVHFLTLYGRHAVCFSDQFLFFISLFFISAGSALWATADFNKIARFSSR
jgi:hypothetical protein